jgi:hypothetical protein
VERNFFNKRKKKEQKERNLFGRGSLWKLPQPWKSKEAGIFFMISTAA